MTKPSEKRPLTIEERLTRLEQAVATMAQEQTKVRNQMYDLEAQVGEFSAQVEDIAAEKARALLFTQQGLGPPQPQGPLLPQADPISAFRGNEGQTHVGYERNPVLPDWAKESGT